MLPRDPSLLKIGACGWGIRGGKNAYFREFDVVELQSTFYRPVPSKTLEKYRQEAPPGFEYSVKAWQAITHPVSSPTWKKAGKMPELGDPLGLGHLRPTPENFRAWDLILDECRVLGSSFLVIQTPPSFGCNEKAKSGMIDFLSKVERSSLTLGWEPRGDWSRRPEEVGRICERLSLVHVVDPLRRLPALESEVVYFRLHGLGGDETNYKYRYTDSDLSRLASIISTFAESKKVYVMFNNISMGEDALRLKSIMKSLKS
uniref:DUF72 domain-containing protein n=1 Tax=Candidatus Methanosuratincola petrocarbonis (ex Vanwonterghem et al. 2016) TaxID=1867261 RepID=A0A7J3V0T5_9CREN